MSRNIQSKGQKSKWMLAKSTIDDFIKGIKDFQLKFMKLEKRERSGAKQKPKEGGSTSANAYDVTTLGTLKGFV